MVRPIAAALFALALPLAAQKVWVVDQTMGPGATHADLPPAIAAAEDGDTVLVRPGTYAAFTLDGKGLVITADVTGFPKITGTLTVRNVPTGSAVVVRGLETVPDSAVDLGLLVEDCAGPVWVEKCKLRGSYSMRPDAARVLQSAHVSFARCGLYGAPGFATGSAGWPGGCGVRAEGSGVVLYDCEAFAGDGLWGDDIGGEGGHGIHLANGSTAFAAGCLLDAGDGGGADDDPDLFTGETICGYCGHGGSGVILLDAASSATLLDNVYLPGQGGISTSAEGCPDGPPGQAITNYSSDAVVQLAGEARAFRLGSPRHEGEATTLSFTAEPGDLAFALASGAHGWAILPAFSGALLLDPALVALPMGTVPASGFLQSALAVPEMADPTKLANTILVQSLFVTPALDVLLGPNSALTILDASL
jgi:hypothetical protein